MTTTNRLAGLGAGVMKALGISASANASDEPPVAAGATPEAGEPKDEADDAAVGTEADGNPDDGSAGDPEPDEADVAAAAAFLAFTTAEASATATKAANARWAAVMGHKEAQGRIAQASTLLETTDLAADAICARLAKFPKEGASSFAERMEAEVRNPNVTAGNAGEGPDPKAGNHGWDRIVAAMAGHKAK